MNRKTSIIISDLFESAEFNRIFEYLQPAELREDAKMDVIAIVCSWPDDKIIKLHRQGALQYFVRKTVHYSVSPNGPLRKKYFPQKPAAAPMSFDADYYQQLSERQNIETKWNAILECLNRIHWYDAELVRLYLKLGTYRAIEQETKIPAVSAYRGVMKTLTALRDGTYQPKRKQIQYA